MSLNILIHHDDRLSYTFGQYGGNISVFLGRGEDDDLCLCYVTHT